MLPVLGMAAVTQTVMALQTVVRWAMVLHSPVR
jgi:hypothetical protein